MIILELMQESHEVILCELIARNWIKRLEKFSLRIVAFFSGLRWFAWLKFSECEILVSRAIAPKKNCPRIIAPLNDCPPNNCSLDNWTPDNCPRGKLSPSRIIDPGTIAPQHNYLPDTFPQRKLHHMQIPPKNNCPLPRKYPWTSTVNELIGLCMGYGYYK